ncbi:hypothetical protein DFA_06518 [Cavenderia fasciculata]|uniref:Uncharacterized protein n=1 Tax=Cavenderia fasciculata TaxID=261658 RepID=F4PJ82_CACFS|nr:uncharacterized protein DFA_06518 [Cavenderia fasciculata]EGG24368.1 hypothetical protein DFA_06518 [Cavenderia fasciculata]|eukprot:XP_004362219.1 hypothetical protein DFA_06518 [Cavenderia fasciculata]
MNDSNNNKQEGNTTTATTTTTKFSLLPWNVIILIIRLTWNSLDKSDNFKRKKKQDDYLNDSSEEDEEEQEDDDDDDDYDDEEEDYYYYYQKYNYTGGKSSSSRRRPSNNQKNQISTEWALNERLCKLHLSLVSKQIFQFIQSSLVDNNNNNNNNNNEIDENIDHHINISSRKRLILPNIILYKIINYCWYSYCFNVYDENNNNNHNHVTSNNNNNDISIVKRQLELTLVNKTLFKYIGKHLFTSIKMTRFDDDLLSHLDNPHCVLKNVKCLVDSCNNCPNVRALLKRIAPMVERFEGHYIPFNTAGTQDDGDDDQPTTFPTHLTHLQLYGQSIQFSRLLQFSTLVSINCMNVLVLLWKEPDHLMKDFYKRLPNLRKLLLHRHNILLYEQFPQPTKDQLEAISIEFEDEFNTNEWELLSNEYREQLLFQFKSIKTLYLINGFRQSSTINLPRSIVKLVIPHSVKTPNSYFPTDLVLANQSIQTVKKYLQKELFSFGFNSNPYAFVTREINSKAPVTLLNIIIVYKGDTFCQGALSVDDLNDMKEKSEYQFIGIINNYKYYFKRKEEEEDIYIK